MRRHDQRPPLAPSGDNHGYSDMIRSFRQSLIRGGAGHGDRQEARKIRYPSDRRCSSGRGAGGRLVLYADSASGAGPAGAEHAITGRTGDGKGDGGSRAVRAGIHPAHAGPAGTGAGPGSGKVEGDSPAVPGARDARAAAAAGAAGSERIGTCRPARTASAARNREASRTDAACSGAAAGPGDGEAGRCSRAILGIHHARTGERSRAAGRDRLAGRTAA